MVVLLTNIRTKRKVNIRLFNGDVCIFKYNLIAATLCCAIINDLKTSNVKSISTYTQQYPELKWLVKCRRLLVISERPEGLHIDCESEDILIEWLAGTLLLCDDEPKS